MKTAETFSKKISECKYDILKRQSKNELAKHLNNGHDFVQEFEFLIIEKCIKTPRELPSKEDL